MALIGAPPSSSTEVVPQSTKVYADLDAVPIPVEVGPSGSASSGVDGYVPWAYYDGPANPIVRPGQTGSGPAHVQVQIYDPENPAETYQVRERDVDIPGCTIRSTLYLYPTKFFVWSRRISVDLLSYDSKTTDKRQQNDWRAKKNLDGFFSTWWRV